MSRNFSGFSGLLIHPEKNSITLDLDNSISVKESPIPLLESSLVPLKNAKALQNQLMEWVTDLDTQLSKDKDLFTSGGGRVECLQAAFSYLGTVLSTSVDCERCFSTAPYIEKNSFQHSGDGAHSCSALCRFRKVGCRKVERGSSVYGHLI